MFKLKKLNARGFSHHMLIAFIILVVGVGGTYWLVKDHADQSLEGTIYTVQNNAVYSMNTDGSNKQDLNIETGSPDPIIQVAVNSAGNELAISTGFNIYTANALGQNVQNITNFTEGQNITTIAWTANNTIVFERSVGGGSDFYQIYSINADGSNLTDLTPSDTDDLNMTVSADGSQILYQYGGNDNNNPGPWFTMNTDGSNLTQVSGLEDIKDGSGNQLTVTTSPIFFTTKGGSQLIATVVPFDSESSKGPAQCTIDSIDMNTGAAQQLFTYSNFYCQSLTLSPDGASIAFSLIPSNPDGTPGAGNVYILPDAVGSSSSSDTSSGSTVFGTDGVTNVSWGPVTPPIYTATCSISEVPSSVAAGGSVAAVVTVTNTGNESINSPLSYSYGIGKEVYSTGGTNVGAISVGGSQSVTLPVYKPATAGSSFVLTVTNATGQASFNCQSNPFVVAALYAVGCSITDVPSTVKPGGTVDPVVIFKNTGNTTLVNIYMTSYSLKFSTGTSYNLGLIQLTNDNLAVGQTYYDGAASYTVPKTTKATSAVITLKGKATNVTSYSCTKSFKI